MKLVSSKVFIGYLFVIVLFAGLIVYISYRTIRVHYIDTISQNLQNLNASIIDKVTPFINDTTNNEQIEQYITTLGNKIRTRITIINIDGNVLADSKFDATKMENHRNRPEVIDAINGANKPEVRYSSTLHNEMLYVASPIIIDGKMIALSRVSVFLEDIDLLTNQLTNEIMQIAIILILISFVIVILFSRSITNPIFQLSKASRKVALGDFNAKVNIKGKDEISELAQNFNNMTNKLKDLFELVNSQKNEYRNLISSIQEGLAVLNQDGLIIHSNSAFKDICGSQNIIDVKFDKYIDKKEFADLFNNISSNKDNISTEMEINDIHYLISANYIDKKNEIVFLFHNINERKKLEQIKKDFVVNVSHELRTPLTAIKGFIETLEDELDGINQHYVGIIKKHTDRLINIVQDLLILSELEVKNTHLLFSNIDLRILLDNVIKIFEQKLMEKNLYLKINIDENLPMINVDTFRFEQVFVNLIDNAIKYTDFGGININANSNDGKINIYITDTGLGIPKEHHSRIFERFYLVDKSRSRKVGGTGLGLSIVKHIILLHNGEISIISEKGKGTTFQISIPLKQDRKVL